MCSEDKSNSWSDPIFFHDFLSCIRLLTVYYVTAFEENVPDL